MSMSQLHRYSIGIAAENKPTDTRTLNVTPVESLSGLDGELNFGPEDHIEKGVDADNQPYEVKVTTDVSLNALWLPLSTNRVTPPDVRRGELIEIYRMADTDHYFWRCMGLRDDLRRLETVIYAFNASPDEGTKGIDPNTCYFLEVSTHRKLVTFATSQANGEPYGYGVQFNTGEGQFNLEDTIGNRFFLDSNIPLIELANSAGTYVKLEQENIYGYANETIDLRCKDFILKAGNSITIEAGTSIDIEAGETYSLKAGNSIYEEAPTFDVKTDALTVESPQSTYSGNVGIGGSLTVAGGISMGSGGSGGSKMEVQGDAELNGALEVTEEIHCKRLVATESVTAPNLSYN